MESLSLITTPPLPDRPRPIVIIGAGDITDLTAVERTVRETGTTHLIHPAELQVPFCKADPSLGARVNVVGTVNIFEAAKRAGIKRAGIKRVVYASNAAVYGLSEEYPEERIVHDAPQRPITHYGVYKLANEDTARIYWLDYAQFLARCLIHHWLKGWRPLSDCSSAPSRLVNLLRRIACKQIWITADQQTQTARSDSSGGRLLFLDPALLQILIQEVHH